jgi:hypothetical protein
MQYLVIDMYAIELHGLSLIFVFHNFTDLSGAGTMHESLEENGVMQLEDQGDGVGEVEDDDIDWEEG